MELKRPLLAAQTTDKDLQALKFPVLASPKIDGVRALVINGELRTRSMKRIPNVYTQTLFGIPGLEGCDGELVVGSPTSKTLMQDTMSGVTSYSGKPNVSYHVFDNWLVNGGFNIRTAYARAQVSDVDVAVFYLEHQLLFSYDDVLLYERECLARGYEGIMIRSERGPYKQGRSTIREGTLLKVKRYADSEAEILDFEPLHRNANEPYLDDRGYTARSSSISGLVPVGMLGSLHVRDLHSGVEFDIGSGFNEAQRNALWAERSSLRGRVIKYKSFSIGVKEKPRFPIFLGFRSLLDL